MIRRWLTLIALAALVAGCGGWWGEDEDPPLPGKRVPVMLLEDGLSADSRIASVTVRLPAPVSNVAWPQSGGFPSHVMQHLAAGDSLNRAWDADVGAGSDDRQRISAVPVIADGRVHAMDSEGVVSAFDAASGSRIWQFEPADMEDDEHLGGGLALDAGWLFVVAGNGDVFGLDAETGSEVWRQSLNLPVRSSPATADGIVLVLTADNQLFALDGQTGDPLWTHAGIFEIAGLLGGPTPAVADGIVIVPYSSGELFALRLDTGRPIWADTLQRPRRTLGIAAISDLDGHPAIDDRRVFVGGHGGEMAAFDLQTGSRLWEIDLASTQTPWVAGDFIFTMSTRGEVVCLLRQGGAIRWVSPLPRLEDPEDVESEPIVWQGPILVGDRLIVAGSNEEAMAVSPYTGELLGRIEVPGPVRVPPVAANGTVYLLTDDGTLLAYR
jgi:outer membrane protein assembly factor BamB